MSEELKPCPFCGGSDQFVERYDYCSCFVQCDGGDSEGMACLCRGPVSLQDSDDEEIPGHDAAIRAWNRRQASFQKRVSKWMGQCFLPSLYGNMTERGDRLLEEVLELLQSNGYDHSRVSTLVDYVYGRPIGEPSQEVGGVMVTLAGYCWIAGLDMHADGERELARINQPEVMAKIRAKQEAKNALHFDTPLPGNANHPHTEYPADIGVAGNGEVQS